MALVPATVTNDLLSFSTLGDTTRIDSLLAEIDRLKGLIPNDSINRNDSLRWVVDSLTHKVLALENKNQQLLNKLKQYAKQVDLPGTKGLRVKTSQSVYDCYRVNLKETNLAFFWQNEKGEPLSNFGALRKHLKTKNLEMVFAMNAGMYKPDQSPQGLYIEEGKVFTPIDKSKDKYGNFYMQPNGIFLIDTNRNAEIMLTDAYDAAAAKKARYATQSGPMVLIEGEINEKFNKDSNSKHIRNGVGIINEHDLVFIISRQRVNLYDFANVFKTRFNCSNALYLDGAISRMYLPEIQRFQEGGNFGPLIGVYKKKKL
ncbi:MAG: phosphodiester glycosidase family protein [Saprospiraceae bacterium]